MLHALAVAAALSSAGPSARAWNADDVRIVRRLPGGPRYLRIRSVVFFAGVRGRSVSVLDLDTGRSAERVEAGLLSYSDGFDGVRAWTADATGMPVVEGNAQSLLDSAASAHFFGRRGPERPAVRVLRTSRGRIALRMTYPALSTPLDITLNAHTHDVERIDDDADGERSSSFFGDYRQAGGVVLPFAVRSSAHSNVRREYVTTVAASRSVPDSAFEPPARPDDTQLDAVTSVPMRYEDQSAIIPVRIDDGPVLHLMLDSGSTNFLTRAAARILHLQQVGMDRSGGVGAGTAAERYARAKRVRIGNAVLRDQPFAVLDYAEPGRDGVIGCELFERLAVRVDVENRLVQLAPDAAMFGALGTPVAMRLHDCNPEIDGEIDGLRGALTIDTGSGSPLDVLTPAVRRHRLLARYHADIPVDGGGGIGGDTFGFFALANAVRLGPKTVRGVPMILNAMTAGAFADPSTLGNVGLPLVYPFTPTFDYRGGRLWLLDPPSRSPRGTTNAASP